MGQRLLERKRPSLGARSQAIIVERDPITPHSCIISTIHLFRWSFLAPELIRFSAILSVTVELKIPTTYILKHLRGKREEIRKEDEINCRTHHAEVKVLAPRSACWQQF